MKITIEHNNHKKVISKVEQLSSTELKKQIFKWMIFLFKHYDK